MFYLRGNQSTLFPVLYVILKTTLHGVIVFYETRLAVFAATGDDFICETNSVNFTCPARMITSEHIYNSFLWYSVTYVCTLVMDTLLSVYFFQLIVHANQNLHSLALLGVIKSPMRFFNINSKGRILSRFSQDLGRSDTSLPLTAYETVVTVLQLLGAFSLAFYSNWMNAVIVVPVGIYLIYQRQYYASTGREIKRLESISKSPIYNYISETMSGRSVLKAAQLDPILIKQFMALEDNHTSVNLLVIRTTRWLGFRLEVGITFLYIVIVITFVELSEVK